MKTADLFDLSHTLAAPWLARTEYPWEILDRIKDIIAAIGETLPADAFDHPADGVWIAKDAEVFPSAYIGAPCIIGHGTQVRQGAFIRGGALVGDGAVIGNSTELKNCILFDGVQAPHFNYVGDAVLGYRAHLGAGAVTSNVKSDKTPVVVQNGKERIETGRRKLGAMVGDWVEVGCNSVLNPGTVIGRESRVYPLSCVRGVVPPRHIVKGDRGVFPMKP
ncbi:MAG: UDP-N-acetylglucosamine pyrophosphorylase [Clostridiales bacterium]|nr:UDP-N-acetylglucosamine pyrophosphorylase [Clostridiales bacterium]